MAEPGHRESLNAPRPGIRPLWCRSNGSSGSGILHETCG
jgi:hypothetical protein